ncbi:MAG: efflux RND transporter periplasmic adaptor subunit [Bacteroidales bacterium]|jgi:HlyD family secretion protein|nr:efflux RND transporter periplasmic adaptor subunit [Bacteroidales bacterium]MCR4812588.1 efflux RND transporter periplasmic adaptor subunit [Bacteroidales bacterium]
MKNNTKSLWIGIGVVIVVVAIIALIGLFAIRPEPEVLMGEVMASEYRVANKVPGRIDTIFVEEGQTVKTGDTLAFVSSPEVDAKMMQAKAARNAATAQSVKAQNGARQQQVASAYEMWQKAQVGVDIAKKSYDRVQALYEKNVVSAQKRDEVEAQYKAAVATANAAKQQYDMAMEGAQNEDKMAAQALVAQASGAVSEVQSYIDSRYLLAPCNGEVVEIYPKRGELAGTGSPVMSVLDMSDVWFTFSVREDMLKDLKVGAEVEVNIPALGEQRYKAKVTQLKAMASYATWRATKMTGQYDVKSFDVKLVPVEHIADLRPGMTVIIKG